MNKQIVIIPGVVEEVKTRKDKSFKISIGTQEMKLEDTALLFSLVHGFGHFAFSPNVISEEDLVDIKQEVTEFKSDKTKSQRLRNVLYVYWQQSIEGKKSETFDSFYSRQMESFIECIKEKLEPIDN